MNSKKIIAGIQAVALGMLVLLGQTVNAANVEGLESTGDVSFSFNKVIHTNSMLDKYVPGYEYSFEGIDVTGNPVGGNIKNTVANMPSIPDVSTSKDKWEDATGDNVKDAYKYNKIQALTSKTIFTEVGTYTYEVTEYEKYESDAEKKATGNKFKLQVDVYKADKNGDGKYDSLTTNYVLLNSDDEKIGADGNINIDGGEYGSDISAKTDIYFENEVTGSKGDTTKDFTYTIKLSDATTEYNFVKQEKQADGSWVDISGSEGTITGGEATITLKHGQRVVVKELEITSTYSIVQSKDAAYKTTVDFLNPSIADKTNATETGTVTVEEENNEIKFINNRENVINTGLVMSVLPYITVVAIAIIGIILYSKATSNRAEKE